MTKHPLKVGDRVRHAGQQYTAQATATIIEVKTGALKTWEYRVNQDSDGTGPESKFLSWWNSEATVYVDWQHCPDGGRCWHECGTTSCFRVVCCAPFKVEGWEGDDWPEEVKVANPASNLRASIEAVIVSAD